MSSSSRAPSAGAAANTTTTTSSTTTTNNTTASNNTSPSSNNVIDEMFPEGSANTLMDLDEPISASGLSPFGIEIGLGGTTTTGPLPEKILHTDYYNDFGDIFDDNDLN